jgi:hypothetical protein
MPLTADGYMQSITTAANGCAQPSTDDDEEDEDEDNRVPNSKENGHQSEIVSVEPASKVFDVDALTKRGKLKNPTARKEPSFNSKQPATKKGKKVCNSHVMAPVIARNHFSACCNDSEQLCLKQTQRHN